MVALSRFKLPNSVPDGSVHSLSFKCNAVSLPPLIFPVKRLFSKWNTALSARETLPLSAEWLTFALALSESVRLPFCTALLLRLNEALSEADVLPFNVA